MNLGPTEDDDNVEVGKKEHNGYASSLWAMLVVLDACDGKNDCVVALEL